MDAGLRLKFEAKYKIWKEKLLDLSGSNRLLNFRPTKVSTIQITQPDINRLFERLVISEKPLKFPLYEGKTELTARWSRPSPADLVRASADPAWRVRAGDMETSKSPPELEVALGRLSQLAHTSLEERGVNTLYVAIGMLEWRPLDSAEPQLAPLLMVPVELDRDTRLNPYVIGPFDEDAEINPSLLYMLRKDFDFAAPEFDAEPHEHSLDEFFHTLEKAVKGRGWRVLRDAWLGQFQFKKLAMYKDLEEHSMQAPDHQVLASVAGSTSFPHSQPLAGEHEFDNIRPSDVFTIRDADSSQLAVILRARAGQDLIVQGPPGTGKSQTIANLIAQSLLEGRKILFVSEKMAALSVVHRRLQEAGLGPFCLEIHSDKANKRDVLARIRQARPSSRPKVSFQEKVRFETLLAHRRELNEYVRALHRPVLHGRSAFDLHGSLSGLLGTADVIAELHLTADDLTPAREAELIKLARKVAGMPGLLQGYKDHPWFGFTLKPWSMQLQATVRSRFEAFRTLVPLLESVSGRMAELMCLPQPGSAADTEQVLRTGRLFAQSPIPPAAWLGGANLNALIRRARDFAGKTERLRTLRTALDPFYEPALFDLDCREIDHRLNPPGPSICDRVRSPEPRQFLAERGIELEGLIRECLAVLEALCIAGGQISAAFQEAVPSTLSEFRRLASLATAAATDPRPTEAWFNWADLNRLSDDVREAGEKSNRLRDLKQHLTEGFSTEFFDIPLSDWKTDFENRYATVWRVFKPDYHRCRKRLQRARKVPTRLSHATAHESVKQGAQVAEMESWFKDRREGHRVALGVHYRSNDTAWTEVAAHLETVRNILEIERGERPPAKLTEALLRGGPALAGIGELGKRIAAELQSLKHRVHQINEVFDLDILGVPQSLEGCRFDELKSRLSEVQQALTQYQVALASIRSAVRDGSVRTPNDLAKEAAVAHEAQRINSSFVESDHLLVDSFGGFYRGGDTDWKSVLAALNWSGEFLVVMGDRPWRSACAEAACSPSRSEEVRKLVPDLEERFAQFAEQAPFHNQVFADQCAGISVGATRFHDLTAWLDSKLDNIGKLHEWIQFREIRDEISAAGIDDFLQRAVDVNVPAESLEDALRKRLLTIQLDAAYEQLPTLRKFQWRDHEQLVREFRDLDRQLMKTYANVIYGAVFDRQPSLEGPGAGQVGFLRRELAKQKKHAPLRKLFRESGQLILDLTPCLLMSPLSVATFLPKDSVRFDVVIFDEASQVPSEEAVGSVLRGKQLIVAGDIKQLPPTRFFERALGDGDDKDDDGQAPLDSLLEDCDASGMQSCRLLWHYRSKHESLISFSNAEFYGDLVTFPAPLAAKQVGIGVRLEHVAEAIYDRGNSRTNRREAEVVARQVEDHCDRWGMKRSLGVIALSGAQEGAIRDEMEKLLGRRPDLETLLKRGRDESFFVKPLENVQGDERDTIIISIGYGKDAAGSLSLNFGPINLQGGEKRLNVAITRARWEVVVVSSILAHDIDETRVQSVGPKLLRRYLSFAQEGRLPLESGTSAGESESPFESAVWEALRSHGIEVDRQVGTSRYRIDMAVKDPRKPGRYLLGIECDGATYHSSAVARDRDRLRQQILESLGWTIDRIWSTDWIRDPKGCLRRILDHINELKESPDPVPEEVAPSSEIHRETFAKQPSPAFEDKSDPYEGHPEIGVFDEAPATLRAKDEFYANQPLLEDEIVRIVDHEGPIHQELLARRVARTFQLMRTGHLVESRVDLQIQTACRRGTIRRDGEFVWSQGKRGVVPRRPAPGCKLRDIDHVPPEELEGAALLVVRLTRGITEGELAAESARVLGYARISDHIRAATLSAIKRLVSRAALSPLGDQLFLAEDHSRPPVPEMQPLTRDDRVMVTCSLCGGKLRVPQGRSGIVKCSICSGLFRAYT